MKKRLAAFAFAALAAFGAQAVGTEGDIWSLEVVPNYSKGYEYPNSITPHKVGESFYILVRLLDADWRDSSIHEWQILQSADGTAIGSAMATVYWPGLRIAIGNEMVTADYVSTGPNGEASGPNGELPYYTDLYFKYTVKEGQLGMPVRLVDSKNKIISTSIAGAYSLQFENVNTHNGLTHRYWNLIKDPGEATEALANFWFCPSSPSDEPADYPEEPAGGPKRDVTKIAPGAYVQTIDFEPTYADPTDPLNRIWRDVYQGISDSPGKDPAIIGTAADEGEATTVYIWSEDESVFSVDGITGETVEYEVKGEIVTRKVYPVQLTANGVSAFKLKGGATATPGAWTNLVLCATKKPAINASGDIVDGCLVTRRVRVVAAPAPFITFSDADGSRSVSLEATSAYTVGSRMKMTFSKAFDSYDVRVKLMMSVGSTTIDPVAEKYIFISDTDGADPASSVSLDTVTMPKGERETYFYIYPLGTCKELKTAGISITNLVDQTQTEAYDQFKDGTHRGMTVKVTDQKPVVTASIPSSGFKNDTVNVDVTVSDNWRDLSETNTNGYRVVIFLGGTKVYETNGVAFAENEQVSFPVVIPAEGNPLTGTVQVWDQMGNASDTSLDDSKISIEAKAPLTVMAATFQSRDRSVAPDTDATYAEGQQVYVGAVLSSPSATKMYAFIVPMDAASSNLVYTSATTNGLEINTSGDFAEYSVRTPIKLLDGNTEGRRVNLGVVLKDKPDWSDATAKVIDTYSLGGTWTLTVTNVAPTFASEGVWGGDETNRTEVANGARYPGRVSATTPVQFSVKLADVGIVDATSGTARVRWTWTDGDAENRYTQNQITTVDSNGVTSATFIFDDEGQVQTITLQLQDRDMFADSPSVFGGDKYVFTVAVGDVPTVIIDYDKGMGPHYEETANSKYNYFTVKVSEWPKNVVEGREMLGSSNPLKVKVTLPTDFQDDTRAVLHLQDSAGNVQVDDDEGVILTFRTEKAATKDGIKVYFDLDSQNGGSGPVMDPSEFIVKAEVITTTKASEDMTWAEYFASIEEQVTLMNIEPSIGLDIVSSQDWAGFSGGTNEWTAGEEVELKWTYKDIAPDVTNRDASVSWTVADVNNKRSVKVKDAATSITFSAKSPKIATATGTYKFKVPAAKYTRVVVTARDGDGGESEYEFYIHVIPTKDVIITPAGPSETASSKYGSAAGLGRGHIYVQRSTGQYSMLQFQQTWLYSEHDSAAYLYAAGYPATNTVAYDDGTLGVAAGFNIAAEPNAIGGKYNATTGVPRYDYQGEFDNYFYCWLQKNQEAGAWEVKLVNPTRNPATAQGFNPTLPTDTEDANNPSYPPVEVEAVFAREYYTSDNLGDINADEIPDAYVKLYSGFGVFGDDGSISGNDFPKLQNFNTDDDYLPASLAVEYAKFIPGPSSDWITTGVPFNARREIRGWDYHLNNGPALSGVRNAAPERRYTDPREDYGSTLSELEYLGFVTWCAKNGREATNETSWLLWTPENPTDPTLADTDGDGVPDGYEYYIWYRAHVGYIDYNGTYRRLVGRRYNVDNPAEPLEISSEEVERLYDPTKANDTLAYTDTDDDGLSDLDEFMLGTNPIDYDTDGDGLPDGFEVFVTESDPLLYSSINSTGGDGAANPDNDAKAELVLEKVPVIGVKTGSGVERFALLYGESFSVTNIPYQTMKLIGYISPDGLVTNTYVTSEANVSYSRFFGATIVEGQEYLTTYLPAASTYKCTISGESVILGESISLDPGTPVTFHRDGVEVLECTVLETPPRAHSVWKYDTAGKLVLGQEMYGAVLSNFFPEGARVVEPTEEKSVTLLHHHVYQYHGLAKENKSSTRRVWVASKAFDPRTAWRISGGVETSLFTHYDEFMYPIFIHRDTYYYASGSKLWAGGYALSSRDLTPGREAGSRVALWQKYCTNPNSADTDGDGTPDGWEAYLFTGKPQYISEDESPYKGERAYNYRLRDSESALGSPIYADSSEGGFTRAEEYAGVESTAAYADCETILAGNIHPEWTNKKWPTDPNQEDTDGDGISDAEEMTHFLYGSGVGPGSGGGLNPLSWDTDLDGLPDPWEVEFAGTYTPGETSTSSSVTIDQTTGATNNTTTVTRGEGSWSGGMDGTTDDARLDYDNDGLLNWQEYLVGAMRCWRYDDTISSWGSHHFDPLELDAALTDTNKFNRYFSEVLLSDGGAGSRIDGQHENYNPRITVDGHFDPSSSYFSYCENSWDPAYGGWYMFADGINHDLKNPGEDWQVVVNGEVVQCNRFTWRPFLESMVLEDDSDPSGAPLIDMSIGDEGKVYYFGKFPDYIIYPTKYICCDPTKKDTDNDGMDDYYELYHGMNPLLGAAGQIDDGNEPALDIVFIAYDGKPGGKPKNQKASATRNYWMGQLKPHHRLPARTTPANNYDFEAYPWLNGLAAADADGDNLRNQTEAIMTDMQGQSTWLHSDPTPLWMTDFGYSGSLTYRYYVPTETEEYEVEGCPEYFTDPVTTNKYYFNDFPGLHWELSDSGGTLTISPCKVNRWNALDVGWSFEENEGYDTDHDYLSDYDEVAGKTKSSSDVRNSDSPLRRQAMWFPGADAFLETTIEVSEVPPRPLPTGVDLPFFYYTVECWAKPEGDLMREQTVVERAIYTGPSNLGDAELLRKNFLIGLKNGRWYTKYDSAGTDKNDPQEILNGPEATTNWTHVAATFDGEYLCLYINGTKYRQLKTGVQPEHGISAVAIDAVGKLKEGTTGYSGTAAGKPVVLIGASVNKFFGIAFDAQWRWGLLFPVDFTYYKNYYQGYVDEVRIWDGARSESEIRENYRKRFTREDALANRQAVWEVWKKGITNRAPSTKNMLPAELKRHWSFDHIPGAASPADVMATPAGFDTAFDVGAKAVWSRPVDWVNPWWHSVFVKSTIYSNTAWVPWISDTVGHLPRLDGTTVDSKYWSEDLLGGLPAAQFNYARFDFPRTMEPYSRSRQVLVGGEKKEDESDSAPSSESSGSYWGIDRRLDWVENDPDKMSQYVFTMRHRLLEGFDLFPLGGAYAKRISAAEGGMWDDGTAADAWAQTGADSDNDNLPDWWSNLALLNYNDSSHSLTKVTWTTDVYYNGVKMPAWQAYLRDLAAGMLSDGKYHPEFADSRDLDHDGIPDWWEDMYKIDTGSKDDATADPDHDGLSNYQEYRIAEVDRIIALDPTLAHSVTEDVTDYFVQTTNSVGETFYLGELYADHDFMEDLDEDANGLDRTRYDANTDADEDGWSAWSEMRYSDYKLTISKKFVSHLAGVEEVEDYPVPVVHATLRYNGAKVPVGSTAPVIVQAYSGNNLQNEPTAVYTVTPGASEERHLYLGFFEDRVFHGTLTPGWVVNNYETFKLQCAQAQPDDIYTWEIASDEDGSTGVYYGTYEEMRAAVAMYGSKCTVQKLAFDWQDIVGGGDGQIAFKISSDDNTMKGHILYRDARVGEIDLVTGDFSLDLGALKGRFIAGEDHIFVYDQLFFRIAYQSQLPTLQTKNMQVALARPDSGKLTEGVTAFVAFIDADGDGAFTPETDPIGFVKDVEVGWDQVPSLVIEMTDSSQAAGERFAYGGGSNSVDTLRIIRTSVNGSEEGVKRRIVYSRETADVKRNTVYEGDLVTTGKFGLDWSSLRADLNAMENVVAADVTEVGYTVTLGGGSVQNIDPASVVRTFTVEYTTTPVKPTLYSPTALVDPKVKTARPEFKWSATDGYTAFRLQIWNAETNVYTSPLTALPPKDSAGRYFWTPPVYVGTDAADDAWVLANNTNYRWRVAMYNAKFSDTNDAASAWSDFGAFETRLAAANDFSTRLGRADVRVRYFGPATNELKSVVVQLFRNADFAGVPAAQTRLYGADLAAAANSLTNAAEVSFLGLDEDEYFAVAFIDRNGNAEREPYETWGYSAQVDRGLAAIWRPSSAKVDPTSSEIPELEVFMEDTDVNRDDVLDWNQPESLLATAAAGTASGVDTSDRDFDGLTGDEETGDTYTNKQKWDTDGDGMPDGWEARYADTDPLMADAELAAAGDYMAFVVANGIYRLVANAAGERYLVRDANSVYRVGDVIAVTNLITTYDYTTVVADETLTNFVTVTYAGLGTNIAGTATFKIDSIAPAAVALVHAQVYDEFGYSQSTAVDPSDANTKPFTALDKYMLARYCEAIGFTGVREEAMNVTKAWKDFTLRPLDPDCDRDGVADGWELYLMFGTNGVASAHGFAVPSATEINPWKYADRDADIDGDTLSLVDEYAQGRTPSDPWDPKSVWRNLSENGYLLPGTPEFTDKEARRFDISMADLNNDDDNDLIANLQEIQAYYYDKTALDGLDPKKAWSDGSTPDYFRAAGSTYLGRLFNGGEFIEPDVRKAMGITTLARTGTRDYDGKGWDAWSTARYSILNREQTLNVDGVVSDELMLLIRYWNVIRPGEFTGTTVGEAVEFFHTVWEGVRRLIDSEGNILIESKGPGEISGPGTIHHADAAQTTTQIVAFFGGQAKIEETIAKNKKDITADEIVAPEPPVALTVKYAGNGSYNLVLEAYQRSLAYPEYGRQLTAQWTLPVKFDAGIATVNDIRTPGLGSLKQGPAQFVAYIDQDGSGTLSAGDIYGTTDVEVGYLGAKLTIRLGGENDYSYPLVRVQATNDCSIVALVRSKINDVPLYGQVAGAFYCYIPNNAAREELYPVEFFTEDHTGIDKYLASDFAGALEQIESVTYEVLHLRFADLADLNVTNLNDYIIVSNDIAVAYSQSANETITIRYSNTRDKADVSGTADSVKGNVTVSFTVPNDGYANMRFWLKVNGTVYDGTHHHGFLIPPIADSVVVLDQEWFDCEGIAFRVGENKVQVLLGNDKYGYDSATAPAEWSEEARFSVNAAPVRAGKLAVAVQHPLTNFTGGVTIAAYETADLVNPVVVSNNVASDAAVVLEGLRPGAKYYLAAWYVMDPNDGRPDGGKRMPWDSWGYYCNLTSTNALQVAGAYGFDPVAVAAGETLVPTNAVWLQDTDYNDNDIADREEDFLDVPAFYDRELVVGYGFNIAGAEERRTAGAVTTLGVMAYAVVPYTTVATTNETGAVVWYAVVVDPVDPSSSNVTSVGIAAGTPLSKLKLASTYYYGSELALGTNVTFAADSEWKVTMSQVQELTLVHAQVLDRFGFNPATANGSIASGDRVYSKDFTTRDRQTYLQDYLANALGVTNAAAYTLSTTADDSDPVYGGMGDGIADGWELYMMFKPDGVRDGVVGTVADLTNELVRLSPWNYSDRDGDLDGEGLSNLLEYDGGHFPTNPYDVDTDGDNVTDLYAWQYALKGDEGDDDLDGDGLSNYAEYLISEVFQFHTLDPRNPKTDGACVDYFRKVGELYLGELFTDHDQVSDVWEAQYAGEKSDTGDIWANRYVYDPEKDLDEDGWSNYAEARAGTSPEVADSIGIDQMTLAEHPVPVIEATVVYNGYDPISGPIVFRAWNQRFDPEMMHAPDAIWTVPSSVSTGSAGNGTTTDTGAQVLEAAKYVGLKPAGRVVYSLGPGSVTPGSVKIYFRDPAFRRAVVRGGVEVSVSDAGVSQASWYALVQDKNGSLVTSITNQTAVAVGSIDYTTGKVEIDFGSAAISGSVYAQMINATSGNEKLDSDITHSLQYFNCEKLNLDASYVKLEWNRTRVGSNVGGVYYLGDADPAAGGGSGGNSTSFTSMSRGYVREGLNSFVVYADQNGDGDYTPGEPFGFVRDVDVGWQGAKFSVELSETSPIFARVNVRTEENDRVNLYGVYSDTMYITNFQDLAGTQIGDASNMTSDGRYIHVRIDRYSVNGVPLGPNAGEINLPDRVLVDKYIDTNVRCVFHEGDFLNDGEFDIDWSHFEEMSANENIAHLANPDITSVAYRIVVDNALMVSPATNNLSLACVFTRRFDAAEYRQVPLLPAEELVCHGARPTFSWSMGVKNTYTAFQLQILNGTTVVYDSGVRHAPSMDPEGRYTWTAPISVGDQMPSGHILSAHGNYTWRVAMYNAKFKPSPYVNAFSDAATFRTDVNVQQDVDDDGFNAINVCVKYTGPSEVIAACDSASIAGKVRLQAFTTADFSGVPSAQALVTGKDRIADASDTMANAKLIGLPAGTYYIRAYIDSNGNFEKDDWESWGQAKVPVTVGAGHPAPLVGLYIEDADTNQDWVPDALEFDANGQLKAAYSPIKISGEFLLSKKLSSAVSADTLEAGVSTYLSGATLTAFQYVSVMGTLLGVNSSGETTTIDAIREAVEKKVKDGTVKITSIAFDPVGKKVVLAVDAEVADTVAGEIFFKVYEFPSAASAKVNVKVFRKDSLVQAEWQLIHTEANVAIGVHSQNVEVALPDGDYTSGFYRVEIEQ